MDDLRQVILFENKFREVITLHNHYSEALKLVEQIVASLDTTTLNDARYALRAIVDCIEAVLDNDIERFENSHATAMTALRIAWHDIVDITLDEFKLYLNELGKKYEPDNVASFINVAECYGCINKIEDLIRESRGHRERRIELYQQISQKDLLKMLALYRECITLEPSMASKYKKDRDRRFFTRVGITISIISLSMAAYNFFLK